MVRLDVPQEVRSLVVVARAARIGTDEVLLGGNTRPVDLHATPAERRRRVDGDGRQTGTGLSTDNTPVNGPRHRLAAQQNGAKRLGRNLHAIGYAVECNLLVFIIDVLKTSMVFIELQCCTV